LLQHELASSLAEIFQKLFDLRRIISFEEPHVCVRGEEKMLITSLWCVKRVFSQYSLNIHSLLASLHACFLASSLAVVLAALLACFLSCLIALLACSRPCSRPCVLASSRPRVLASSRPRVLASSRPRVLASSLPRLRMTSPSLVLTPQ
jgi:hypothetical protein